MNPEIKAKWIAALRSGEYRQGHGQLREKDKFCCLGVLCDIYAKEHGKQWLDAHNGYESLEDANGEYEVTPLVVRLWADLPNSDPDVMWDEEEGCKDSLSTLNDNGQPFAFIAQQIEKHL